MDSFSSPADQLPFQKFDIGPVSLRPSLPTGLPFTAYMRLKPYMVGYLSGSSIGSNGSFL
jgi:hypothetical protein